MKIHAEGTWAYMLYPIAEEIEHDVFKCFVANNLILLRYGQFPPKFSQLALINRDWHIHNFLIACLLDLCIFFRSASTEYRKQYLNSLAWLVVLLPQAIRQLDMSSPAIDHP